MIELSLSRWFGRMLPALGLVLAFAGPTVAAELTAEQNAAIAAKIEILDTGMRTSDMSQVMGLIPPKVLEKIASTNGITAEQLIAASQEQIAEALKTIKIESHGMDMAAAEATTLPDGTIYVLIPTETVIDMGANGKVRSKTTTVGLLDADTWYLMAIDIGPQVAILKEVYPALAGVEFPAGSMEPVTE